MEPQPLPIQPETGNKWLAFILTLEDGQEACPSLVSSDDPLLPLPKDPSTINVEENYYYKDILAKAGKIKSYRFEFLSWQEIISRKYRENPQY